MWNKDYELYPYQRRAALQMLETNVLLAFEMGTGKTPTTLWAIEQLRGLHSLSMGTVVVPSSLKYQWADEIRRFTDQRPMVIDGPSRHREYQYKMARDGDFGYLIVSYDNIVRDWDYIRGMGRAFMVLDEATAIKSHTTKRSKHIKKIAKQYFAKFALTGTPIENGKAEELFSIMQFVDDEVLGNWYQFEQRFVRRNAMGWIEGYRNVGQLHTRLHKSGTFARATHRQPEVAKYLPKVVERPVLRVPLGTRNQVIVDALQTQILNDLDQFAERIATSGVGDGRFFQDQDHPDGKMMSKITLLRRFLSNPLDIEVTDHPILEHAVLDKKSLLVPWPQGDKMAMLEKYLDEFFTMGGEESKAVVFTSFVSTAERIYESFAPNSSILTGRMSAKDRQIHIDRFKKEPATALFVSTDAGGYGLDLPQANLLINFDLPWQPGLLAQRNARIKRASSEHEFVVIQHMVVEGTIEERMLEMLQHKMSVADAVVDGKGMDEAGQITSDLDSLRKFLAGIYR